MVEIVGNVNDNEWHDLLFSHSGATLYHTPEWKKFLEKTFDYKPHYLFANDECGQLAGMLPLFHVRSRLTGNRLLSVPFAHECNPLGSPDVLKDLVTAAIDLSQHLDTSYIELRGGIDHTGFISQNVFSTYILQLVTIEKTWSLIHKSAKRYIKKSMDSVNVTHSNFKEDADIFYQINCINKKRKGVPAHPENFFKNLTFELPDSVNIYLAKLGQDTIGGIITLDSGTDTVIYGYGASDPKYLDYSPVYACLWKSIEDACLLGRKYYDFGRVSSDNMGLIDFKKKWGAQERKLYYSYYPESVKSVLTNRDSFLNRLGNTVIRRMPMSVYTKFSDVVFPHLG